VHPAWGALPILAAAAIVLWPERLKGGEPLRGWVASAAVMSLVLATALRGWQIHDYISEHLARLPPHDRGAARQFVFVKPDRDYYFDADLVQNDPFLRAPTIYLLSRGESSDQEMMRRLYPRAHRIYNGPRGQVWRID
jgi:hypothetical protein